MHSAHFYDFEEGQQLLQNVTEKSQTLHVVFSIVTNVGTISQHVPIIWWYIWEWEYLCQEWCRRYAYRLHSCTICTLAYRYSSLKEFIYSLCLHWWHWCWWNTDWINWRRRRTKESLPTKINKYDAVNEHAFVWHSFTPCKLHSAFLAWTKQTDISSQRLIFSHFFTVALLYLSFCVKEPFQWATGGGAFNSRNGAQSSGICKPRRMNGRLFLRKLLVSAGISDTFRIENEELDLLVC